MLFNVSRKNTSRNVIGRIAFPTDMSPAAGWRLTLNFAYSVAHKNFEFF